MLLPPHDAPNVRRPGEWGETPCSNITMETSTSNLTTLTPGQLLWAWNDDRRERELQVVVTIDEEGNVHSVPVDPI